jgi:methyl-accepting chemotaxis protein
MKLKLKLAHKIMLLVMVVVAVSVTGVTIVSTLQGRTQLVAIAKTDLAHLTSMALQTCILSAEQSQRQVKAGLSAARYAFDGLSKNQVTVENGQMILDGRGAKYVVNDDIKFVDRIMKETGSYCTVFLKEGTKARRISTNIVDKAGNRAIGTYLSDPVYNTVVRDGQPFTGRALVVDQWLVTAYEPIRDIKGDVVGVLFCGVPERSETLRTALLSQKVGLTGYLYTLNSEGVLQIHPAKEGANLSTYDFIQEMKTKAPKLSKGEIGWIQYGWINKELGETQSRDKIVAYTYFPEWDWIIGCGSYLEEFTAPVTKMRNAIVLLGCVCMLISLFIAWYLAMSMTRPIKRLIGVAEAVSEGDVNVRVDTSSQDEVGVLALAFQRLVDYMKDLAGAAESIAANNLTIEVKPRGEKDVLGNSFKIMVHNLTGMVRQLGQNATELVSAANQIASSSEEMSRGAQEQAQQMGQVSSAVEEISATILESSKNAGDASEGARGAAATASTGGEIVSETIRGMQRITDVVRKSADSIAKLATSADQIGEIISVIDDIADQTNLLALNAAIEAARAGEQGRGFAVVADEVRKLAERTGKATREITDMIKGIQVETQDAVKSMETGIGEVEKGREMADRAGSSLNEVVTGAQRVMDMITQIATAAEQQSAAAEEISKNIESVTAITRETAKGVQESAAAAEELNRQAESLQKMVSEFKVK